MLSRKHKMAKKSDKKDKICFVIMPFGIPFDRYYKKIYAPAALNCGFKPFRVDSLSRPTPIIGDIQQFIEEAEVIIAVTTGNHLKVLNVLYEMGIAQGKGKTVILIAEKMNHIPSDLRGNRVLIYDKDDESWGKNLRMRITSAIKEAVQPKRLRSANFPSFQKNILSQISV